MTEFVKVRSIRLIWIAALASIGTSSAANAGAILVPSDSGIDATILVALLDGFVPVYEANPAHVFYDIRGSAPVVAPDDSTRGALGTGDLIGDGPADDWQKPLFEANEFVLLSGAGTLPESIRLTFDLYGSSLIPADPAPFGARWLVPVVGAPIGSVTDPFLLAFLGNNIAELQLTSVEQLPRQAGDVVGFAAHRFGLVSIENVESVTNVPEPSTLGVIAVGLFMIEARRRKTV